MRTSVAALLMIVPALGALDATPAVADPVYAIAAIPTNYNGASNSSGGLGDVRASWRNDGAAIAHIAVTASAPPSQYFQRSAHATVYMLAQGSNIWDIDSQPDIASACDADAPGTGIRCDSLSVDWPPGGSLAISFPTYVAPGTPLTGAASIEPGSAMLVTVGSSAISSNEATAIGSVDPVTTSTTFPLTGSRLFSGTANPGTMVSVADESGAVLGAAPTDNSGAWQLALPPGYGVVHSVYQTVDGVQSTGTTGYYNSYTFALLSPGNDSSWSDSTNLSGTGQPQSRVVIDDEAGIRRATAVVDSAGQWSTVLRPGLSPGNHQFTIVNTVSDGSMAVILFRATIVATPPLPAAHLSISVSGNAVSADGESVRIVRLVVTDTLGRPVAGRRVSFSAPMRFDLSARSAITDVHGTATTTFVASRQASARVSATIDRRTATTVLVKFISSPY
jgi:hypothetical protein